jgi:hypothetical protein
MIKMKTMIQRHVSFITDPSGANMGDLYHMRMMFTRERLQIHYRHLVLIQLLRLWTLSIILFFYPKQHFGDWILSPSSGKSLLSWAHLREVVLSPDLKMEIESSLRNVVLNKKQDNG